MTRCNVVFRTRGMLFVERCDLPAGHSNKYHQHSFDNWTARAWDGPKGVRFRYFAKPGKRLPDSVTRRADRSLGKVGAP